MKSLTIEIFDSARPEYGRDVTLSITHNGCLPEQGGEVDIYLACNHYCDDTAHMIISCSQDEEACYMITSDTAIANDTYLDLITSLQSRIINLFGGYA